MKNLIDLVRRLHSYHPWVPSNTEQTVFSKKVSTHEFHFATWDEPFSPSKAELDDVAVAINLKELPKADIDTAFDLYFPEGSQSDLNHEEIEFLRAEAFFQIYLEQPAFSPDSGPQKNSFGMGY